MYFVFGLPKSLGKFDSIRVLVGILTKSTHFIPVRIGYNFEKMAKVYVKEIVRVHGLPSLSSMSIVPSLPPRFGGNYMMNWTYN